MLTKLRRLITLPSVIYLMIVTYLPGSIGFDLRHRFWRKRLKFLGQRAKVDTGVSFQNPNFIFIDDNSWIDKNVIILAGLDQSKRERVFVGNKDYGVEPGVVHVGKNVHIAPTCLISGISAGVFISDDCNIAAHSKIYALSHHYRSEKDPKDKKFCFGPQVPEHRQYMVEGPVFIGKNTGIALNVVILPGVSIPDNCFVKINSVVHAGEFYSNSILAGNPAIRVGERFKSDE
jgi:acetyltransferase-like isoleucine patch superfamily enzyme